MVVDKKIIKILPADFSKHCTRDISLLSCSIFGESHIKMNKLFGSNFSVTFWVVRGNQVNFYRPEKEYFEFSKEVAELCEDEKYSKWLSKKLIEMTNWFDKFFEHNNHLEGLMKDSKTFFEHYREFFAYHQAAYWGGDYLSKFEKKNKKVLNIVKRLDSAYKYNELVVPKLEKYFRKLKISHLLYDEVNENIYRNIKLKPKNRGLLFIKSKRTVYIANEASQLEKLIERRPKVDKKLKEFKGIGVSHGKFIGSVRRILNLNKFKECKKDDVLVTTMTRPQFNSYIKKVGAIITDEGGMLCHASILAREFNIPCVVGTKIATEVLKDGDIVEVNGNHGVVTVIKRNK